MTFQLDTRLENDTITLAENDKRYVLLMNNAAVTWLILVPKTTITEWHELPETDFTALNLEVKSLAALVKSNFSVDKMNVATIGNVVEQLHIHIIGRSHDDFCWPNVVWGRPATLKYQAEQVESIKARLNIDE